jgi:hypothetical protein
MNESTQSEIKKNLFKRGRENQSFSDNTVYGLGFIGASIHYLSMATSFWIGVLGILKALVWPAFLIYGLLQYITI